MYDTDRHSSEYMQGVRSFLNVAEANTRNGFMCCPFRNFRNEKDYSSSKTLHIHLIQFGFMSGYNCWTKHGERGVIMEDNEEEEYNDNYLTFPEHGGTTMGEDEEPIVDEPDNDLSRAINDAHINCESQNERLKLERILEDHRNFVYPICEDGQKNLGTTLEFLQ